MNCKYAKHNDENCDGCVCRDCTDTETCITFHDCVYDECDKGNRNGLLKCYTNDYDWDKDVNSNGE